MPSRSRTAHRRSSLGAWTTTLREVPGLLDDRPPICPACGVTMGMVLEGLLTEYACLECGFAEEGVARSRRSNGDA